MNNLLSVRFKYARAPAFIGDWNIFNYNIAKMSGGKNTEFYFRSVSFGGVIYQICGKC